MLGGGRATRWSRRHLIGAAAGAALGGSTNPILPAWAAGGDVAGDGGAAVAGGEWRKYTALAPLGAADAKVGGRKRTGMALEDLAKVLARDVAAGATGKGGYFISGDLSPEVFRDDCRFVDPTNDVSSLSRYKTALGILFDPQESKVELLSGPKVDAERRTIKAQVRSSGVLKLPWRPYIRPYETSIVWSVDGDGLVQEQAQAWSITAADALLQSFNVFGGRK